MKSLLVLLALLASSTAFASNWVDTGNQYNLNGKIYRVYYDASTVVHSGTAVTFTFLTVYSDGSPNITSEDVIYCASRQYTIKELSPDERATTALLAIEPNTLGSIFVNIFCH